MKSQWSRGTKWPVFVFRQEALVRWYVNAFYKTSFCGKEELRCAKTTVKLVKVPAARNCTPIQIFGMKGFARSKFFSCMISQDFVPWNFIAIVWKFPTIADMKNWHKKEREKERQRMTDRKRTKTENDAIAFQLISAQDLWSEVLISFLRERHHRFQRIRGDDGKTAMSGTGRVGTGKTKPSQETLPAFCVFAAFCHFRKRPEVSQNTRHSGFQFPETLQTNTFIPSSVCVIRRCFFHLQNFFPTFTFLCISGCFMPSWVLKKVFTPNFFSPKNFLLSCGWSKARPNATKHSRFFSNVFCRHSRCLTQTVMGSLTRVNCVIYSQTWVRNSVKWRWMRWSRKWTWMGTARLITKVSYKQWRTVSEKKIQSRENCVSDFKM